MRPRFAPIALLIFAATAANGQAAATLRVNVLRPLEFGAMLDGVESALKPTDGKATAMFEIRGPAGATVQLTFTLPTSLQGEGAGRVGLTFGPQSAAYSVSESTVDLIAFDPRAPFTLKLPPNGRVVVMIGGSARYTRQLISGKYVSSLSLSVTVQQ